MLRKIFGLLIFPILGASVHTYAQEEYDQQIFQYINQEKWFDAKSLYDTRHDDLSEVIRLISGAFLGAYFNRPAEGVAAIEELLAKYGTARGTSRHVQDAGCQEFCLYACLCENGFCIHLYAGLRRPLPRRPDPEGDCLGAGAMPEDSPAAPDGGDRPLAGGFPRHGRHGVGGRPILPERRLLRQKRENPAGYRGRIYFDRPEPGRRTGCPDISGFTADVPGILHETGNSRLPANRIHHPQKRDLLCLPRRSGGTESGPPIRASHGSGRCWGFRR